jgi:predicted 3-demethylubiquinone-9 3-methyltransferase (glyoxalase superfamily)
MPDSIYPCLWFDGNALEAAEFYCSILPESRIVSVNPIVVIFQLRGRKVMALNGGPKFHFTEAISLVVECANQDEVDHCWEKLTENGGEESRCGWLKDKFGLSWQIVPTRLGELMREPSKAGKVMEALLKMNKLIIADLEAAAS